MIIDYEQWCKSNSNIIPLARALKSSVPEQYIGFYLHKIFGEEIEYQKQFDWLKNSSLDIYIPSLQLAIEYDGTFYHNNKAYFDSYKTSLCRSHGIHVIRILEQTKEQLKTTKRNEISYYYAKKYINIDMAINELLKKINKKYALSITCDVDLNRDERDIISYVQTKYYKESIACIWPESTDYWDNEENIVSVFDVLRTGCECYKLTCPHCGQPFKLFMRYVRERKSLIPCICECKKIEDAFQEAIKDYIETGKIVKFDNSLDSRRLYDRMASAASKIWNCSSKAEAEMYKKLGFNNPCIDIFLNGSN